jgi:hypothetical protein
MEPQDTEPAGDYGYDMAHEDVRRPKAPEPPETPEHGRSSAAPRGPDLDQDYGYDEAHSF